MGYVVHNIIAITTFKKDEAYEAMNMAMSIGLQVTQVIESNINTYFTFFVCPSGSKSGWPNAIQGNKNRDSFVDWLMTKRYEDGSNCYEWAEMSYGSDPEFARIERSGWDWLDDTKEE